MPDSPKIPDPGSEQDAMQRPDPEPDGGPLDAPLFYRLDALDRIIETGGDLWDTVAAHNDGDGALRARVEGTTIFKHICDDATRLFLWTLLDGVRKIRRPVARPYRCDSPTHKRFMEMSIEPDDRSGLVVRHRVVRTESLRVPVKFRTSARTAKRLIVRCSMCNRLRLDGAWLESEDAARQLPVTTRAHDVAYGVCDDCKVVARLPAESR